jgi:hypothetical protein
MHEARVGGDFGSVSCHENSHDSVSSIVRAMPCPVHPEPARRRRHAGFPQGTGCHQPRKRMIQRLKIKLPDARFRGA